MQERVQTKLSLDNRRTKSEYDHSLKITLKEGNHHANESSIPR